MYNILVDFSIVKIIFSHRQSLTFNLVFKESIKFKGASLPKLNKEGFFDISKSNLL